MGVAEIATKPDSRLWLWCPFCNDWKQKDSMIARKRLGTHIVDDHTCEVRFPANLKPPELIDFKEWLNDVKT